MIKFIFLTLIDFYQRFLSPVKGFTCAHHSLYRGDTCSNAIKKIIQNNSLRDVPRLSKARFRECKDASSKLAQRRAHTFERSDLPCDVSCVGDIGCFDSTPGSNCFNAEDTCSLPCDACLEFKQLKRRTKIILLCMAAIILLAALYYYGSQTTKLEVTQLSNSQRSDSIFEKFITRDMPSLRAKITTLNNTYYSDTVDSSVLESGGSVQLNFSNAFSLGNLRHLELQDAHFSVAQDIIVVGQTIESIEQPKLLGNGKRFKYEFKSRWGF